jgi:integrase
MRGIWRRVGRAQTPARPLLHQELAVIVEAGTGLRGARDRAVLLVGFKAALRRSELVGLNVEDIGFCEQGVLITVRRSKTDQEGYGRTIAVPTSKRGPCAVAALRQWLAASELSTGALFRSLVGTARLGGRLPAASVTAILRRYAAEAGLELTNLSAHSLRAGFVTSAAKAGSGVHSIQRQTGHKSIEMVFRYVRSSNLFAGNANDDFDD